MLLQEIKLTNGYVYELENEEKIICIGNILYNNKMQRVNKAIKSEKEIITIFNSPFYLLNDSIHNSNIVYQKTDWSKVEKGTIVEYAYADDKDEKYLGYFKYYEKDTKLFEVYEAYNERENDYKEFHIVRYCELLKLENKQ